MTNPSRFPLGLNSCTPTQAMNLMGQPDPTKFHQQYNDFNIYTAGDWIITEVGSGTRALTAGDGGLLLVTNAAADNDGNFFQGLVGSFLPVAGKKLFFKAKFKVSDATQSDVIAGLQVIDTTPLSVTDGIFFQKDDGDAHIDVYVRKNTTTGNTQALDVAEMADNTYSTWAFAYDGVATTLFYIDDACVARLDSSSTYLPDTVLTLSFGIQNGEAVAKTMTIDYVFAAMER